MKERLVAVTGATGNTGRIVVERLLKAGVRVRAIARDPSKLALLADLGAEVAEVSLEKSRDLARAFWEVSAAYLMVPTYVHAARLRVHQDRIIDSFIWAIRQTGVRHVVSLSSVGAHLPAGTGPVKGLHGLEERLNALPGVHVVHLRAAFFMENYLLPARMIEPLGFFGTPLKPGLSLPHIATRDIGPVAADLLLRSDFEGKNVRELLGPADITPEHAARVLLGAIGRSNVGYSQLAYPAARKIYLGMGMSSDVVEELLEMYQALNRGLMRPTQARGPETDTPTTIEDFAPSFRTTLLSMGVRA